MKIKVAQAIVAHKALTDLKATEMDGSLSYQIKKLRDLLAPISKNFEDTKNELIKDKYGDIQEDKSYKVGNEKMPAFIEEINKVLEADEDIAFTKFKVSLFSSIKVTPEFFDMMEGFIEE